MAAATAVCCWSPVAAAVAAAAAAAACGLRAGRACRAALWRVMSVRRCCTSMRSQQEKGGLGLPRATLTATTSRRLAFQPAGAWTPPAAALAAGLSMPAADRTPQHVADIGPASAELPRRIVEGPAIPQMTAAGHF